MDPNTAMNYSTCSPSSSNKDERLDAAWAKAEREYEDRWASPRSIDAVGETTNDTGHSMNGHSALRPSPQPVSPLMAHASDATLQTSNRAPPLLNGESNVPDCGGSTRSLGNQRGEATLPSKKTMIQRYRTFLQKHEPSLDLVEHVMERFVFYGYLFKHDRRGISTELYYAAWNLIRWMNDVVLVGWGEGMGTTVGRREEWLPLASQTAGGGSKGSLLKQLDSAVPILRAILTATTCIYPAMEAWSRRSPYSNPSYGAPLASYEDNPQSQEEYQFSTASDPSPQRRRLEWEGRQCRAAQVSYRLERVKFLSRLALLSISWWAQHQRRSLLGNEGKQSDEKEGSGTMPSLLRRGGELDPYEQLVPLKDAEDEAKVVQYVGRRTGRRSIARGSSAESPRQSSRASSASSTIVKWLRKLASSKNRVLYAYVVGELLHILRPLYWSRAESRERQRRALSPKVSLSSFSFGIWKAWWVSLLMDLLSDKLLQMDGGSSYNGQTRRRSSLLARGERHSHEDFTSAEQAKLDELEWRRSRHAMYLLRSPMYDGVTRPCATFIAKAVSLIPSFGLGQWAAEYALDLMSYWNDNRFMLES